MRHFVYLFVLAACVLGTLPLELLVHVRVYARWTRLVKALLPTVIVFGLWDLWASATHTWRYDARYLVGVYLPGRLPVEELLFFIVVPTCAILTLEAVRARRPTWLIGDERSERQ
ncbi:MAG: lycopene cyclase domain-containing protein [Actinomycetota bacterium]|nr:lycopene cyclase domain-containing protein [Actinomycetota bacterium]